MPENDLNTISVTTAGTLDGLFRERVRQTPELTAYRYYDSDAGAWAESSWHEMAQATARWQAALAGEGLDAGDRVAVQLPNCREWVMFDQAALGLGLVVVPLYLNDRAENLAYILNDAGARLLVIKDAVQLKRLQAVLDQLPSLQRIVALSPLPEDMHINHDQNICVQDWLPDNPAPLAERAHDPHALATIVYTSGTTGPPKGVMLSHHNILSNTHAALEHIEVYTSDTLLSFLPLAHMLERNMGYYLPMMTGSCVAYARSIQTIADDLQTIKPTALISVPRVYERFYTRIQQQLAKQSVIHRMLFRLAIYCGWKKFLYDQKRGGFNPLQLLAPLFYRLVGKRIAEKFGGNMRILLSGGAALPIEIAHVFVGLGLPIVQGYGLTEYSPAVCFNPLEDNIPESIGVVLPGTEIKLAEQNELLVRGPSVMLGYWHNEKATREAIDDDGWLHTGDQVHIKKGHIYITGRLKDILVMSNGENVPPDDMESAILTDPLFDQAMIIGEGRSYLVALVVLNPDDWKKFARKYDLNPDDNRVLENPKVVKKILTRIGKRLHGFPAYAKVRRVILLHEPWTMDNGLLTPTLKKKRNLIEQHYAGRIQALYQSGPSLA